LISPTVESEADGATFPWTDKTPADMQEDITVTGDEITGKLKFIEGGLSPSGWLSGDGYFMALKFEADDWTIYDSVKVGLNPSQGSGLVEIIDDPDKNGVFKIKDTNQRFIVECTKDGETTVTSYGLTGLVLESMGA